MPRSHAYFGSDLPRPRLGASRTAVVLAVGFVLAALLPLMAAGAAAREAPGERDGAPAALRREIGADPAMNASGSVGAGNPPRTDGLSANSSFAPAPLPQRYALTAVWESPLPYPGLYHPEGMDVADDGVILVAERGNHRITALGARGDLKGSLGSLGSESGQLRAPEDVAIVPGGSRIYVADTGNRRVALLERRWAGFDLALSWIGTWEDVGLPRGIAADRDGKVYVADAEGHRILVFDALGNRLASWGGYGRAPGSLDTPLGISIEPGGRLHIADSGNQRVLTWDLQGNFISMLRLDNAEHPGGIPYDVAVDEQGDIYVSVERGVLRFRRDGSYIKTLPPLRLAERKGCSCYQCPSISSPSCCPAEYLPEPDSQEGVRRLAIHFEHGIFFSYAPEQRFDDRIVALPKRNFESVFPAAACGGGSAWRNSFDPERIDAGAEPQAAMVLDTTERLRIYRDSGQWYDRLGTYHGGPGLDIASDRVIPYHSFVLTGNLVLADSLQCRLGCDQIQIPVLDDRQRQRRDDKTGDLEPDFRRWLTALAVDGQIAVLDAGRRQVILRQGFSCGGMFQMSCTSQDCQQPYRPVCLSAPLERLLTASINLGSARETFRAFRDLAYDSQGNLRILAADGEALSVDPRGRDRDPTRFVGLRGRPLEALAADREAEGPTLFALAADGWLLKHDDAGRMLAAWKVADEAGPGRYRDLTVDQNGRVMVPDGDHDRILVFERQFDQPSPPPPDSRGPACTLKPQKAADPFSLPLGQMTELGLDLEVDCGPAWAALDVVIAIDTSCQMGGERLASARAAGQALVDGLRVEADRLAVVGFNDELDGARLLQPLTDDKALLREALAALDTECLPPAFFPDRRYDARNAQGLRAGGEALFGPAARPEAGKALVLVSASTHDREEMERQEGRSLAGSVAASITDRQQSLWEAWRLWERGVRVYPVGLGLPSQRLGKPNPPAPDLQSSQPPDEGLLSALAFPPSGYRLAERPADLAGIARDIGLELSDRVLLQTLVITDRVPINMRLVPGSVQPPATLIANPDPLSSVLIRWDLGALGLPSPGVGGGGGGGGGGGSGGGSGIVSAASIPHLSYRLEPLEAGRHPANVEAAAVYTDGLDYPGRTIFPVPELEIIGPTETPPATETPEISPTPLDTATPSPSPTATAIPPRPTPTPRPTGVAVPVYLPILFREQCVPKARAVDVALVIDTSSSMAGAKIEAAKGAGRSFVELMEPARDRATIIGFDNAARLAQPLTADRAALARALDGLTTAVGTRIDLGLWAAVGELTGGNRRPEADRVIVLLTDGRPQLGTEPAMREAAKLARDVGVATWVIGLGEDVLPGVLADIAGSPERVYLAPGSGDLAAIYREIARLIPCR